MARYNTSHSRAENSKVDLEVYCPPEVITQGGPLFGDIEGIQKKLDDFLASKLLDDKFNIPKCLICGYPDCECRACSTVVAARASKTKTKAPKAHSCALSQCSLVGAPPKERWYDQEMQSHLAIAWQEKGVPSPPTFFKQGHNGSGYYWPEEDGQK